MNAVSHRVYVYWEYKRHGKKLKRAKWGNLKHPDLRDGMKAPPQ